jgi:hypothetical protein
MALADRNSEDIFDSTGGGDKRMTDDMQTQISASYASNIINEVPHDPSSIEALVYQIKLMQEDIDELRRYVTNEATGSAVNLATLNGGNLPTADTRVSGKLWIDARSGNAIKVS